MDKAFEKQIKTIQDQGRNQLDALKDLKDNKEKQAINDKSDDKLSIQGKIFNKLLDGKMDEIQKICK